VAVLGGSMAGLLAARVLSERFERVVVIERDQLPPIGEHRRGVPHGRHLHGLHPRGREILDAQIAASLVVDATGRGSRTPVWLGELGYPRPAQDRVEIGLGYATRTYVLRPGAMNGDQMILTAGTPANPRAGVLAVTEGGRHMLTIAGIRGDHPPTDPAAFDEFAAGLPSADITIAIAGPGRWTTRCRSGSRRACATGTNGSPASRTACWSWATPCAPSTRSTGRA
jgi:hypothetical protein